MSDFSNTDKDRLEISNREQQQKTKNARQLWLSVFFQQFCFICYICRLLFFNASQLKHTFTVPKLVPTRRFRHEIRLICVYPLIAAPFRYTELVKYILSGKLCCKINTKCIRMIQLYKGKLNYIQLNIPLLLSADLISCLKDKFVQLRIFLSQNNFVLSTSLFTSKCQSSLFSHRTHNTIRVILCK